MKSVREGYKMTEVGEIPCEWNVHKISEVANTTSGGTPSRTKKEYYENGIYPWVKTGELYNKYIEDTEEYITEEAVKRSSAKLVPQNSVIIAMYGATIGKLSIAKREVTTNQACCAIICDDKICHNEYVYYRLDFEKENIVNLGAGGAQPNISQEIIKNYRIAIPTIEEQEKIASILSTVDEQIDNVYALIEKNKELKKGLMQTLLTKGIGHTKFKNTEVGEIPEEWEIDNIQNISEFCSNGFVGTATPYYSDNGTNYLMSNNVRANKIDTRTMIKVNSEFVKLYPRTKIFEGDMLTVQSGHIGTSCVVPKEYDSCNCHALIITRFNKEIIDSNFVSYYLNSDKGVGRLSTIFVGSTIKHINVKDLVKFKIPIPSIEEQEKISSILSEVDRKIEEYENKKQKIEEFKKGLMQQLLTGKIRVS